MANLILIGGGDQAKVTLDAIYEAGGHRPVGYLSLESRPGDEIMGVPSLGHDDDLPNLIRPYDIHGYVMAIGEPYIRIKVHQRLARQYTQLQAINIIHPKAYVAREVQIGNGVVIMAGAVVQPGCRIGDACLINTKASLDHDSVMEDHATLAPGATTGGNCYLAQGCWIGMGATVLEQRRVGAHSVIGAGAVVTKDIPDEVLAYGVPAKVIRSRDVGESVM